MATGDWRQRIAAALGADGISDSAEDCAEYGRDWTRVYEANPAAVVWPRSTEEVASVVRICSESGVAIVPSGGRTGLAGGAMASAGEVVLSLERMRTLGAVDTVARTVRVQAGAVTQAVHQHCEEHGLTWPVDFASSGSSQIGGNIATNAGGVHVVRYGLTRQWVVGLQVVTPQGDILELNGALEKNNTGVDLRQLFIGSEGTLGIITEATLKLAPLPGESRVAVLAVRDLPHALELFREARSESAISLLAFEYFTDECLMVVLEETKTPHPLSQPSPAYVLVELEKRPGVDGAEDRWLEALFERGVIEDGVLADSSQQSEVLWGYRERISESLSKKGFVHKNDVSVSVARLAEFTGRMLETFKTRYPDYPLYFFGHVGDGNLHVNIMKPESMDQEAFLDSVHATDSVLFELIAEHEGSVSAEHGIGLLKKKALSYSRSPVELEILRGIKRVLDPHNLMNPGKIFDQEPSESPS